ncbi:MAG: type II toxin-antitoxin system HicB family antitoxin [Candidatus Diapherotrites archaeon]|nr:type II toxin-antitoxin system HicB family antitoxin [Candidatus Diapherotrites archaeon]
MKVKTFDVIVEKSTDKWFIGSVPALPGCYSQGKTEKALLKNMKEAIELHLETLAEVQKEQKAKFVGIKKVAVYA